MKNVLRFYMKTVRVIEPAIPGLGHKRQAPPISASVGCAVLDSPRNHGVARDTDAVGISNNNRTFKKSAFFDPMRAGHFAVAVQAEHTGVNRIVQRIVSARNDCGNAGADRAFAGDKFSFATNDRGIADFYAGYIGDGVEMTGRTIE